MVKMREIKFRAWDKDYKKMISVDEIDLFLKQIRYWKEKDEEPITLNKGDYELMQFTGLKDKNGKEIYEGDIIRLNNDNEIIGEITFEKGCFVYLEKIGDSEALNHFKEKQFEIIGNKFENPELLK